MCTPNQKFSSSYKIFDRFYVFLVLWIKELSFTSISLFKQSHLRVLKQEFTIIGTGLEMGRRQKNCGYSPLRFRFHTFNCACLVFIKIKVFLLDDFSLMKNSRLKDSPFTIVWANYRSLSISNFKLHKPLHSDPGSLRMKWLQGNGMTLQIGSNFSLKMVKVSNSFDRKILKLFLLSKFQSEDLFSCLWNKKISSVPSCF